MYIIKYFLIIIIIFPITKIFSQQVTEEEKQSLIKGVEIEDTSAYSDQIVLNSIDKIIEYNISEAIPSLADNIWKHDINIQYHYLKALSELSAPSAYSLTVMFLDTISNNLQLDELSKLKYRVKANEFLIKFNDYSKSEYLFQLYNVSGNTENIFQRRSIIRQLIKVIHQAAQYETQAKLLLENAAISDDDSYNRFLAMDILKSKYGISAFPTMQTVFNHDPAYSNRSLIIKYAYKYRNSQLKQLLSDALYIDTDYTVLTDICHFILDNYSCPVDYKYIQQYSLDEPDTAVADYVKGLLRIHPLISPDSIQILSMVDSLSSYIPQCSSLSWIDTSLANTLATLADSAKSYLVSGDSVSCAKQLVKLKQKADYEFADSLNVTGNFISENGRIFINVYTQHILDRLPAVPIEFNFNIKILNNSGTIGEAVKEPLPANLSFHAAYAGTLKDKVQNTAEKSN